MHSIPALIEDDRWPDDLPFVVLAPQYAPDQARACQLGDDIAAFLDFPPAVDVRLTLNPGVGHGSWGPTYDLLAGHDIYTWLLEHERP